MKVQVLIVHMEQPEGLQGDHVHIVDVPQLQVLAMNALQLRLQILALVSVLTVMRDLTMCMLTDLHVAAQHQVVRLHQLKMIVNAALLHHNRHLYRRANCCLNG